MTKRKDPTEYGKRGRPPNIKGASPLVKEAGRKAKSEWSPVTRESSRAVIEAAVAQPDTRVLRYLERDVLLAFMCGIVDKGVPVTKIVSLGAGQGYELVDMVDEHAKVDAAKWLYDKLHGREAIQQHLHVHGQVQAEAAPKYVFVDYSNGRGPT